jgi:flavin-dependent dehydrogenase
MPHDVLIIGGGLAGCGAALHLARQGADVLLLEKNDYPRHTLCGEFLSPESQQSLDAMGVLDDVRDAGAHPITDARLTAPGTRPAEHALPGTALGLSRYRLDALLFKHAVAAGADGRTSTRVTDVAGSLDTGFVVETADGDTHEARVVLGAYGKRARLDRTLDRPFLNERTPYVAFKAHYAGASVPHTIELHGFPGGYCGCSHVEDDRLNVCWIGHVDALKDAGGTPEAMIDAALQENNALAARLRGLERVSDRFEAVSQVSLADKTRFVDDVCMIGDTAGMIAPLCGDGMAMALRTADLVAPLVTKFLDGTRSATSFRTAYEQRWSQTFGTRMRVGRWAHQAAFSHTAAPALVRTLRWVPPLARLLIRATRGPVSSHAT